MRFMVVAFVAVVVSACPKPELVRCVKQVICPDSGIATVQSEENRDFCTDANAVDQRAAQIAAYETQFDADCGNPGGESRCPEDNSLVDCEATCAPAVAGDDAELNAAIASCESGETQPEAITPER